MNSLKKFTCGCLAAAIVTAPLTAVPIKAQAAAPKLNKTSAVMTVGKKMTLKVQNVKKGTSVKWSSTKKAVATVSAKGVVAAKTEGKTTIKAVVNKKTLNCKITVKAKAADNISADSNPDQSQSNTEPNTNTDNNQTDISALLAGKTFKGTAATPIGNIEAMKITFHEDGTATGSKINETTMMPEEFSGTYKAVLNDKKAVITIEADGKTITEELTAESEDFTKFTAEKNIMGTDISIVVEEVKEA